MPKPRTIHGIDLYAPGGLDALFAYRRAQFGDAVMQLGAGEAAPAGDPAPAAPAAPAADPAAPAAVEPAPPWGTPEDFDPAKAWALIQNLRADLKAKSTPPAPAPAAPAAPAPVAAPAPDPVPAAPVEPQADPKDTALAELKAENAILRSGGNPLALAVIKGEGKLTNLDPSADTFQADIDALVKETLEQYPQLRTVQAAGASGADFTGQTPEKKAKPTTLAGAVAQHYGAK